nr:YgiQ family radical SAM protein [Halorhodospira abdelmalekii]
MKETPALFDYRPHWAARLRTAPAPFLPMSLREMGELGWDRCDVVLICGDAYIDHPSFAAALVGRLLEAQGFRVGIIAQPDWRSAADFQALGRPELFFGITAGNMDSMVNRYTADGKRRRNDAYSPDDAGNRRPDRAVIVYSQRAREAYPEVPIVIGGIEASLRRLAHYDYWSDRVRRSILLDAKADLLLYGNAERALVDVAHRTAAGEPPRTIQDLRGTAVVLGQSSGQTGPGEPPGSSEFSGQSGQSGRSEQTAAARTTPAQRALSPSNSGSASGTTIVLPSFEQVRDDPVAYAYASRVIRQETNPYNARPLIQPHGDRAVCVTPPPLPLSTAEFDALYELPYARAPHPSYGEAHFPSWEMIRFSVNSVRGCFGGCTFCSITEHEGRIIQSRSPASILREFDAIRERTAGFTGVISDLGGPSANMYRLGCRNAEAQARCRRQSCLYPRICSQLRTDHEPLIQLLRQARNHPGIKRVLVASGIRYDLAVRSKGFVRELVTHHVGGYLKIAPEHTEPGPLAKMLKPDISAYDRFKALFDDYSRKAGKEQYLIPYFIAAHPGTRAEDMLELALWLKRNGFRPDQVQAFLPAPMALATTMYHTGIDPLQPIHLPTPGKDRDGDGAARFSMVTTAKGLRERRLHKAFLRYHDPENWPLLREALQRLGRDDLIGPSKRHLVPAHQPRGAKQHGTKQQGPKQRAAEPREAKQRRGERRRHRPTGR